MRILNQIIKPIFSEKIFSLATSGKERAFPLSPLAQLGLCLICIFFLGWTVFSASYIAVSIFADDTGTTQAFDNEALYEKRIAELSELLNQANTEARAAQNRFGSALEQVSAIQSKYIASKGRLSELELRLASILNQLESANAEHDQAQKKITKLEYQLHNDKAFVGEVVSERDLVQSLAELLQDTLSNVTTERDQISKQHTHTQMELAAAETHLEATKDNQRFVLVQMEEAVNQSLSTLDNLFSRSDHDGDALVEMLRTQYSGQGGPIVEIETPRDEIWDSSLNQRMDILFDDLSKLYYYRVAVEKIPFLSPLKSDHRISSGFGARSDPFTGKRKMHNGTDFSAPSGTPIYATAEGIVTFSGRKGSYGLFIEIQHDFGYKTRYAHLKKIHVKKGQQISIHQRIGDMGNTGRSTGTHLHYELVKNGRPINAMKHIRIARDVF